MTSCVFVYGTLMFDEVREVLFKRHSNLRPACLSGYSCYILREYSFPGIIPHKGGSVVGAVVELTAKEIELLDTFELKIYEKRELNVTLADKRQIVALSYVLKSAACQEITHRVWDAEFFKANALGDYVNRTALWIEKYSRGLEK